MGRRGRRGERGVGHSACFLSKKKHKIRKTKQIRTKKPKKNQERKEKFFSPDRKEIVKRKRSS